MIPKPFLKNLEDQKIVDAIQSAESKTSGEIRVFISDAEPADPLAGAKLQFERMEMTNTKDRNGVLIFVAPRSRNFAIIGDEGVHAKCGEQFWRSIAAEMTTHFKSGHFTDGIVHGVWAAGQVLSQHFPRQPDDINELPDKVERS
ncbi:MAG TPA: TPM domain-containing protein [Tepidisphaeraceae bacterium]|jgi:uncharacterized membrane protein|nr:TPM domain-containing protein [Tepidisphaeraceae bacterium]